MNVLHVSLLGIGCVALLAVAARASDETWKPAAGPLMTRWAKDVSPDKVHPEYPRPQMTRPRWQNLNGLWQFTFAKAGDAPPIDQQLDAQILVPFPPESALSGVMKHGERMWYRRQFEVPGDWKDQRVLLHFGAVDWEANVWVNGKKVGAHRGGYDPFTFDVTEALKPSGPQELIVGVFDPTDTAGQPRGKQVRKPEGIFYTPTSGIWQTVWIEPVPLAHIERLVLTPDVDRQSLGIKVETGGRADSGLVVEAIATAEHKPIGDGVGRPGAHFGVGVPDARLWSPDDPFLYELTVSLKKDGQTLDTVQSYFGMRKIELARDGNGVNRLLLNGKPLFQIGLLDQGFWPDGLYTAPSDEALRSDVEMTKQLGFNMARKHVKVEPARWYHWCDKLGVLVWQDMPSANNDTDDAKKQFELELARMIEANRNSPSIVMWVVFNEGWGQYDTERLTKWVKETDPTRLVNNASGWTDKNVGDVIDLHAYPGPGAPARQPARASVLGEFGGLGLFVAGHTWSEKSWGYQEFKSADELTRRYVHLLSRVWGLKSDAGLEAAVYTQTTDVETECNGLLTYDRARVKMDADQVRRANLGQVPTIHVSALVTCAVHEPVEWRYTFDAPPSSDWMTPDFDDAKWKRGPAGFGTERTPGAVVRTKWDGPGIWLRRRFTLDESPAAGSGELRLLVHHDEDCEVYLNGVRAAALKGHTFDYVESPIAPEAMATLRKGGNTLAVHCRHTKAGQYIDVGITRLVEKPAPGARP